MVKMATVIAWRFAFVVSIMPALADVWAVFEWLGR